MTRPRNRQGRGFNYRRGMVLIRPDVASDLGFGVSPGAEGPGRPGSFNRGDDPAGGLQVPRAASAAGTVDGQAVMAWVR